MNAITVYRKGHVHKPFIEVGDSNQTYKEKADDAKRLVRLFFRLDNPVVRAAHWYELISMPVIVFKLF
jgi:hypothetical protein